MSASRAPTPSTTAISPRPTPPFLPWGPPTTTSPAARDAATGRWTATRGIRFPTPAPVPRLPERQDAPRAGGAPWHEAGRTISSAHLSLSLRRRGADPGGGLVTGPVFILGQFLSGGGHRRRRD